LVESITAGADLNFRLAFSDETAPLSAARSRDTQRQTFVAWLEAQGAQSETS
jgi:hypothetical protein